MIEQPKITIYRTEDDKYWYHNPNGRVIGFYDSPYKAERVILNHYPTMQVNVDDTVNTVYKRGHLERFDHPVGGCAKCKEVEDFSDWLWEPDPGYVVIHCHHCDYEWLERWSPESIIPPYNEPDGKEDE